MKTLVQELRDGQVGWPGDAACVDADAAERGADRIEALEAALAKVRTYIAASDIAGAVVAPDGETPRGDHPSLIEFINSVLGDELTQDKGQQV